MVETRRLKTFVILLQMILACYQLISNNVKGILYDIYLTYNKRSFIYYAYRKEDGIVLEYLRLALGKWERFLE